MDAPTQQSCEVDDLLSSLISEYDGKLLEIELYDPNLVNCMDTILEFSQETIDQQTIANTCEAPAQLNVNDFELPSPDTDWFVVDPDEALSPLVCKARPRSICEAFTRCPSLDFGVSVTRKDTPRRPFLTPHKPRSASIPETPLPFKHQRQKYCQQHGCRQVVFCLKRCFRHRNSDGTRRRLSTPRRCKSLFTTRPSTTYERNDAAITSNRLIANTKQLLAQLREKKRSKASHFSPCATQNDDRRVRFAMNENDNIMRRCKIVARLRHET